MVVTAPDNLAIAPDNLSQALRVEFLMKTNSGYPNFLSFFVEVETQHNHLGT